jgi:hypothetical protein
VLATDGVRAPARGVHHRQNRNTAALRAWPVEQVWSRVPVGDGNQSRFDQVPAGQEISDLFGRAEVQSGRGALVEFAGAVLLIGKLAAHARHPVSVIGCVDWRGSDQGDSAALLAQHGHPLVDGFLRGRNPVGQQRFHPGTDLRQRVEARGTDLALGQGHAGEIAPGILRPNVVHDRQPADRVRERT